MIWALSSRKQNASVRYGNAHFASCQCEDMQQLLLLKACYGIASCCGPGGECLWYVSSGAATASSFDCLRCACAVIKRWCAASYCCLLLLSNFCVFVCCSLSMGTWTSRSQPRRSLATTLADCLCASDGSKQHHPYVQPARHLALVASRVCVKGRGLMQLVWHVP